MTFMHKLSRRLAMLKDRWVVFSTAALALATLSACEKPIALTGPDASAVWRLVISPKILTLRQNQTADFTAIGLTSSGNPASGGVSWTVTSGAITDTSTSNGQHYGRFQAASDTGKVVVVVREVAAARIADTAVVTVTPVPVAAVAVIPLAASVQVGGTVQLATATKDSAGAVLGGRAVTWASGNLAVADRKSTRLNSSHSQISYAAFCLKKKTDARALIVQASALPIACRTSPLPTIRGRCSLSTKCPGLRCFAGFVPTGRHSRLPFCPSA